MPDETDGVGDKPPTSTFLPDPSPSVDLLKEQGTLLPPFSPVKPIRILFVGALVATVLGLLWVRRELARMAETAPTAATSADAGPSAPDSRQGARQATGAETANLANNQANPPSAASPSVAVVFSPQLDALLAARGPNGEALTIEERLTREPDARKRGNLPVIWRGILSRYHDFLVSLNLNDEQILAIEEQLLKKQVTIDETLVGPKITVQQSGRSYQVTAVDTSGWPLQAGLTTAASDAIVRNILQDDAPFATFQVFEQTSPARSFVQNTLQAFFNPPLSATESNLLIAGFYSPNPNWTIVPIAIISPSLPPEIVSALPTEVVGKYTGVIDQLSQGQAKAEAEMQQTLRAKRP